MNEEKLTDKCVKGGGRGAYLEELRNIRNRLKQHSPSPAEI
jgi:hypothetical protein